MSPAAHPSRAARFSRDRRAVAAVEFAIVAPLLIFLIWGAISYGGYFMLSHNVQQIANNAARAAIAGLDDTERRALAEASMAREGAALPLTQTPRLGMAALTEGDTFTVTVTLDATTSPFFAFAQLGPMPPARIARDGKILLGGF